MVVVKQPFAGNKCPQPIMTDFWPGTYIPGNADTGIKFHNRAWHNAMKCLNIGDLPKHASIINGIIEIGAAIVQTAGDVYIFAAVKTVGN